MFFVGGKIPEIGNSDIDSLDGRGININEDLSEPPSRQQELRNEQKDPKTFSTTNLAGP